MRRARLVALLTLGTVVSALVASAPQAVSTTVVVSQVYGGGGNAGATYTHDFVELFNRGSTTVSLNGWSIQYASATGTGNLGANAAQITELPDVSLAPGQYFLVQEASTAAVGLPLPTPDVVDASPILMSGTAGKIALVNTATSLGCNGGSAPCSAAQLSQIVDLVGYGTANFVEGGAAAPTLSNTTAALRAANGCTDTDNNATDFAAAVPTPRNTASSLAPCAGPTNPAGAGTAAPPSVQAGGQSLLSVAVTPGTNPTSTGLAVTADLTSIGGAASQSLLDDGTNGDATAGDNAFSYLATVGAGTSPGSKTLPFAVTDTQARSATGSIALTVAASCGAPFTRIPQIQGSGATAAITGTVTTEGVVVGDFEGGSGLQGFYLQDADGDADPATSDGIFVFTATASGVSAGQLLRVTGFARERNGQTTLNGANSNTSPVTDIAECGTDSVAPTDVTMPFADAAFPERFEGMIVRLPQSLVISEYFNYERFGELVLALPLPGETRAFTPTAIDEPGAPAQARALANGLRRITLDDGLGMQNPDSVRHPNGNSFALDNRFRGGDTVQNTVGVLGFDFSLYRIQPTGPADFTAANPRPAEPESVGGSLRVAAMNTLNFFLTLDYPSGNPLDNKCGPLQIVECRGADADQPLEFTRQRDKLIAALAGLDADVIGLNELENTAGVDPLDDPSGVVAGLNDSLGAGTYASIDTGVLGTDAIRVGLIYKPASVAPVGSFEVLDSNDDPRFRDTLNRPVLAQTFEVLATGANFTVVVNHLKSKGSDCNAVGDPDTGDGQGNCNLTRRLAAQALVDWLATDPTGSGDPDFLIMGDLNSYAQEDPIDAIKAGPDDLASTPDDYRNLIAIHQGTHAYSFVFDGQAGYLDHALASPQLVGQVTGATEWHINADEPDLLDYDTSFKPPAQEAIYEPNAYRSSDHDPVTVGLDLCEETPPTIRVTAAPSRLWPPNHTYRRVTPTVTASDNSGIAPTVTLVSVTSNEPDNAPGGADGNTVNDVVIRVDGSFDLRAERNENGTGRAYTIRYRATDACGNTAVAIATVIVPVNNR